MQGENYKFLHSVVAVMGATLLVNAPIAEGRVHRKWRETSNLYRRHRNGTSLLKSMH